MSVGPSFDQCPLGDNRCLLGKCSASPMARMRDNIHIFTRKDQEAYGGAERKWLSQSEELILTCGLCPFLSCATSATF